MDVRGIGLVRKQEAVAVFLVLLATVGTALAILGYEVLAEPTATVELVARAPERGNWSPRAIEIEKGKETTLRIRNADIVTHGFYLPDLGLNVGAIKAGDVYELTFTPDTAGEFTFYCGVWCSDYHMQMRGTLIVR